MSFNEISEFRKALSQLSKSNPGLVKGGHRSLMWIILSYPDGCFIGQDELADQAGFAVDTVKTYLRDMSTHNFILREQKYARKGLRQCYRINVQAMINFNSVAPGPPSNAKTTVESGTGSVESGTGAPDEWHLSPAYRYKNKERYERVKIDRFNLFISLLPAHLKGLVQGPNIDAYLDRCEAKNVALEATARHLSDHNYDGALNPHAIAIGLLDSFSQSVSPILSKEQIAQRQVDQDARDTALRAEQNRRMGVPDHENEYLLK